MWVSARDTSRPTCCLTTMASIFFANNEYFAPVFIAYYLICVGAMLLNGAIVGLFQRDILGKYWMLEVFIYAIIYPLYEFFRGMTMLNGMKGVVDKRRVWHVTPRTDAQSH